MATTTARRKKTTLPAPEPMPQTHELISISATCKAENLTEQSFRLALMELRPDDFDSIKAIPQSQIDMVLSTLTAAKLAPAASKQPQLEDGVNSESFAQQELQPSPNQPQKQQNFDMVASGNSSQISGETGAGIGEIVPGILDELIQKSDDDIALADLIHVYRNEQILSNAGTRDKELIGKLRELRQENRVSTFDKLRDLNSRQPIAQELPELDNSLEAEIAQLSQELGKPLTR